LDWSNLSLNDTSTLYFVGIIVVILGGFLIQRLVPGVAGKVLAFAGFIAFLALANWAIKTNFGDRPYMEDFETGSQPASSSPSTAEPVPASAEPAARDYSAPVPASGSGE
jgi:hypothetical protein